MRLSSVDFGSTELQTIAPFSDTTPRAVRLDLLPLSVLMAAGFAALYHLCYLPAAAGLNSRRKARSAAGW